MAALLLATLNARFAHSSFGLRYLLANLGDLRPETALLELEITTPRTWSVTGVVTEFRSGNFLLVTRATLKRRDNRGVSTKPRN